jgi:2-iminoacetate synthase
MKWKKPKRGAMSFYPVMKKFGNEVIDCFVRDVKQEDVIRVLSKKRLEATDFLTLLSPAAEGFLEEMAKKAHDLTVRNFGRTILLYTPMYLADHCVNHCLYCGFNASVAMDRSCLSPDEVDKEAEIISRTGLKHILILTGESRSHSSPAYIKECVKRISKFFTSIAIEVYPLETDEYADLIREGADSLTLYQETYNETLYDKLHVKGPKKNFRYRLDAPERGCLAGMRAVNIGALLGLDTFHRDVFMTGLHARYLQNSWPDVDVSVSFPRMRPHGGVFSPENPVTDRQLVQAMTAMRIFMPRAGITISTRETETFRNNILPLGVTKMSAGSCTQVGGRSKEESSEGQFRISDERSVEDMARDLVLKGYQPVYKDWEPLAETGS